jgi:hypothetical protein
LYHGLGGVRLHANSSALFLPLPITAVRVKRELLSGACISATVLSRSEIGPRYRTFLRFKRLFGEWAATLWTSWHRLVLLLSYRGLVVIFLQGGCTFRKRVRLLLDIESLGCRRDNFDLSDNAFSLRLLLRCALSRAVGIRPLSCALLDDWTLRFGLLAELLLLLLLSWKGLRTGRDVEVVDVIVVDDVCHVRRSAGRLVLT